MSQTPLNPFSLDEQGVFRPSVPPVPDWLTLGFGSRLASDWPAGAVRVRQVHSDRIVNVKEPWSVEQAPEADALVCGRPGLLLAIRTADCLPILMVDERTRAVAAVHAGWRGTAQRIAAKTIAELQRSLGSQVEDLRVWLGPGIGECCFEVGPEVTAQFAGFTRPAESAGKSWLNLTAANTRQLTDAGVQPERIHAYSGCTRCDPALFHSWRRDGERAGRMTAAIGVRLGS